MKSILASTATALVVGLAAGVAGLAASPAQAQCVRVAALDLNGDNWIDGDERRAARNAGFHNFDANGDLFVSAEEMNTCLSGSAAAFRWLSSANPNYASAQAPSAADLAPAEAYAPAQPMTAYRSYDRGTAYDTPAPIARENALRYLEAKVAADPRYQPRMRIVESPELQQMTPAAGLTPDPLSEFSSMDLNRDGVVSPDEYQAYRNMSY